MPASKMSIQGRDSGETTALAKRDVILHAETGAGKTLGFLLPVVEKAVPDVPFQALIVCPSSELAVQTAQVLTSIWDLSMPAVGLVVAARAAFPQF